MGEKVQSREQTLEALEGEVVQALLGMGRTLLSGVCELYATVYAKPTVGCRCGSEAVYQRRRVARMKSVPGEIAVRRPYYLCAACHHGCCPLDERVGLY